MSRAHGVIFPRYDTAITYRQAYIIPNLKWVTEWADIQGGSWLSRVVCLSVSVSIGAEWTTEEKDKEKPHCVEFVGRVSDDLRTIYH